MTAALPTDIIIQCCRDKKWQYTGPIENLDEWVAANTDTFDPQVAHLMYWPDRPYQDDLEILIVDGATTQAPVIARTNPRAQVTAVAPSKESLDHAIYLKHKYGLENLELQLLPADEVSSINRTFDLIIASGVLQNSGQSEAQLTVKALAQVLRPDGVAAFLLFSRYLPSYPDAGYRTGEIGAFLHTSGPNFSVQDCLDLVEGAGLVFQDWLVKSPYYLPRLAEPGNEHLTAIGELPDRQMWSVLEPLRNQTGCHLFTACRPERPSQDYQISFDSPATLGYVPMWRPKAGLDGCHAVRPGWSMELLPGYREMAQRIDGHRSIRQIAGQPDLNPMAIALFKELWRMDFVTLRFDESVSWSGLDEDGSEFDSEQDS